MSRHHRTTTVTCLLLLVAPSLSFLPPIRSSTTLGEKTRQESESPTAKWSTKRPVHDDTHNKQRKKKKKNSKPRGRSIQIVDRTNKNPPPILFDENDNRSRLTDPVIGATCPHFDVCAGCTVGDRVAETHVTDAAERFFAEERYDGAYPEATMASSSFPVSIPSPLTAWRTQAKLVATNKSDSTWMPEGCVFGLYRRGSHQVVPIPQCIVHHPSINKAVELLEEATAKARIAAFSAESREGDLRYVQLQVERYTGKVCLTLVWNSSQLKACQPGLSRLVKTLQQDNNNIWHSIWCHCNDSMGNNIFSRNTNAWHHMSGPEYLREPIPVRSEDDTSTSSSIGWFHFSPRVFRQGNLDGFDVLARHVARAVPPGAKVCELYAGVGVLGLTALAWHATNSDQPLQWLHCSDENPSNPRAFAKAVASLPQHVTGRTKRGRGRPGRAMSLGEIAERMDAGGDIGIDDDDAEEEKTSYLAASAAKAIQSGQALGANVLIVDPPRKGLEQEVLDELCKPFNPHQPYVDGDAGSLLLAMEDEQINWLNDIQTLVYVSCGFDALARDCDQLLSSKASGWTLKSTQGFILFPGSDHVETLAVFQRK